MPSLRLGLGTQHIRPLFRGLLDKFNGSAAAYSLRKLSKDTTNVVRVRRASDNDERDFTASQVSSGEMVNWVTEESATSDGFVETWYDQSGNGNDATQSVAGNQPKIVDGGTLVTNGIDWDGTDDFLQVDFVDIAQPNSIFAVAKLDTPLSGDYHFIMDGVGASSRHVLGQDAINGDKWYMFAGKNTVSSTTTDSDIHLHTAMFNTTASTYYLDAAAIIASSDAGTNDLGGVTIGARQDGADHFWNGTIAELIVYPDDQSETRTAIESNINAHYDIYA